MSTGPKVASSFGLETPQFSLRSSVRANFCFPLLSVRYSFFLLASSTLFYFIRLHHEHQTFITCLKLARSSSTAEVHNSFSHVSLDNVISFFGLIKLHLMLEGDNKIDVPTYLRSPSTYNFCFSIGITHVCNHVMSHKLKVRPITGTLFWTPELHLN
jgi:hypothetical protein